MGEYTEKYKKFSVGWMLSNLKPGSVLDVGSHEASYLKELFATGNKIIRNDTRELQAVKNEEIIRLPMELMQPEVHGRFDNIIMLSTLEHIGLKAYGNKEASEPKAYQKEVLRHSFKLLNKEGRILVTLPYGKFEYSGWYYVYDEEMVEFLCRGFPLCSKSYYCYDELIEDYAFVPMEKFLMDTKVGGQHTLVGEVCLRFGS